MVRALAEVGALLRGLAQPPELAVSVEVRRELPAGDARPRPLADGLGLLLEGLPGHQREGFLLVHLARVDAVVEDGVRAGAQQHLQALHARARASEAVLGHEPLPVDRPALHERAVLEHGPDGRVERVTVHRLEVVPGHRLVLGEVDEHALIVLAVEGRHPLGGPGARRGGDRVDRILRLLERAGRVAVGDRDPALVLGHLDDAAGLGRDADEVLLLHEAGRVAEELRRVGHDGLRVRRVVPQAREHPPDAREVAEPE